MKQQDNHSQSKANSTAKDINTSIKAELSNNEFQKTIVTVTNNMKRKHRKLNI
jgi:hypothetical protein